MKPLVIALLALAGLVPAGEREHLQVQQSPSFRVSAQELVVLPVTVTDRRGRFVPQLPMDRFSVYDNNRAQPISLFSNEDTPVTVGLVIDSSASMRSKLGAVVAASVAFAKSSNPADELFVLEFNEGVKDAIAERTFLHADDVTDLQMAISSIRPEGRTALYDGLIAGLDRLDRGDRPRKVLVVMSDGGDNASVATQEDVLARAKRSNAVIFTIGMYEDNDPEQNPAALKTLARVTGGERFTPSSPGLLIQACLQIAREIRNGYTMAFEPPDHDGAFHKVRVNATGPDGRALVVRTRDGYMAGVAK